MKAAALAAMALGLCVAFPGPIQAKEKSTFCVGKDGKKYAVGGSYVDNEGEACIRYKCAKRKGKFIMKKEKCDCNGGNHGISCCPNYVRGDMVGGSEIKITFSPNTENGCQNSCKVQHPTSIGVTQDHDGTSSCYCEFGSPIIGGSANVYKTCLFSTPTSGILKTIKRTNAETTTTTTAPTTTKAGHLPQKGNWKLLFRQTLNGQDELFKKNEWYRNKENVDEPNFSRLGDFEKFRRPDGSFHLFLWYPELGKGNEWSQTSNPVTKTSGGVDNYKGISTPYTGYYWGGLERGDGWTLLDGSAGNGHWWFAIGSTGLFSGGIPGPRTDDHNYHVVRKVELYVDNQEPKPTVESSTDYAHAYRGSLLLENTCEGKNPSNYWLTPNGKTGEEAYIILNLGRVTQFNRFKIKNTHNGNSNDRGAKNVGLFTSNSKDGPWNLVADKLMTDARNKGCNVPLEEVIIATTEAQFIKLVINSYYGYGGGLKYLGVDLVPDSIYFIAGGVGALRDIELYHPTMANLSCSMSPSRLNKSFRYHTTFYYNNTIYLCGGTVTASTCISYNINTEEWKTHTLSTPRCYGHSSTILNKRVYIIGGKDCSANYVGAESTPLPLTDQPVMSPVMNLDYKGYYQCTAKIDEDTLVVTGGYYNNYLSSVIEYNAKTRTTTSLPSMKQQRRSRHGCAVVEMDNTKWIIVAGGLSNADRYLKTTEMLRMGESSWKPLGNLNVARRGHSIAVTQRGVMAMGGYDASGPMSSVELLDWSAMSWKIVQPSLSKSKSYFGGAVEIPASMFDCRAAGDGEWSAWSKFTACSATCGNTTKTRNRTCSNPSPSNGGKPCPGLDEEFVSCGLSPCGFNMAATCDDVMWLFADEDLLVNNSSDWRVTSEVHIPACTKVIEIHCLDSWIHGGILASSDNGLITDGAWNCSSDNRTTWNPAYLLGRNGRTAPDISPEAIWIWTDMSHWMQTDHRRHTKAICKIELETSQCPEPPVCPPFGELTPTTISTPTPAPTTTTTLTTSKPKPGFNLTATCDNEMKLFVDGNLLATSRNWRDTSKVYIPANTEAIEIHCMTTGTVGGILASSDNGLLTDGAWNCSSDNGTTWSGAYEVGPNSGAVPDISPEAEWIWTGCIRDWTSKYTGKKYQKNIICKIDLKPVIDGGWSTWRPFSPCSATCADATKARTRTCSQPSPNNGGNPCLGLEEEVVSCGLSPCGEDSCPYTDKYMDCPQWKNHCESGQWEKCVKENCPKTCNCTVDMCTGDFYENGRPPVGTKCVEKDNKMCYIESGRWGKSWCYTEVGGWGAECVKCSDTTTTSTTNVTTTTTTTSTIVVTGGEGARGKLATSEVIGPEGVCSGGIPPLPVALELHASVFFNNQLMVCGGVTDTYQKKCYFLKDAASKSWMEGPSLNIPRAWFTLTKVGDEVFAVGGEGSSGDLDTIEKLSGNPAQWKILDKKMSTIRELHCTVYWEKNNSLVVIGGNYLVNIAQSFNLKTGVWSDLAQLPVLREHACSVYEDTIVVTGGWIHASRKDNKEIYVYKEGNWETNGEMDGRRRYHTMDILDGKLLVIGGTGRDGIEQIHSNGTVQTLNFSLSGIRQKHSAAKVPAVKFPCFH